MYSWVNTNIAQLSNKPKATPPLVPFILTEVTLQRFKGSNSSGPWESPLSRAAEQGHRYGTRLCSTKQHGLYGEAHRTGSKPPLLYSKRILHLSRAQAQLLVPSSPSP